jgi:D-serine deaminase-like pyridoxal phosphate-dependent protein
VPPRVDAAGLELYRRSVGRSVEELATPVLLVDLEAVRRNIAVATECTRGRVALRPHAKTHKSVELARLQVAGGAIGVTTATVWEAAAMARGGIESILIANEVVGSEKIALAAETACTTRLTVVVDDIRNAHDLSAAAAGAGTEIGFLVDVDIGMNRCGVRSPTQARVLAARAAGLVGLSFEGVMGYEGHCVLEPDRCERAAKAAAALERLAEAVEAIVASGLPVGIVSSGGTGTYDMTSTVESVTELQLGSYVFLDTAYARVAPVFEVALTVLATVISRQEGTIVLDCGTKTVSAEHAPPEIVGHTAAPRYIAEEHAVFAAGEECSLDVGDRVNVVTGHCCATTNLHAAHHVVVDGVVTDIWPIVARGPGRGVDWSPETPLVAQPCGQKTQPTQPIHPGGRFPSGMKTPGHD